MTFQVCEFIISIPKVYTETARTFYVETMLHSDGGTAIDVHTEVWANYKVICPCYKGGMIDEDSRDTPLRTVVFRAAVVQLEDSPAPMGDEAVSLRGTNPDFLSLKGARWVGAKNKVKEVDVKDLPKSSLEILM